MSMRSMPATMFWVIIFASTIVVPTFLHWQAILATSMLMSSDDQSAMAPPKRIKQNRTTHHRHRHHHRDDDDAVDEWTNGASSASNASIRTIDDLLLELEPNKNRDGQKCGVFKCFYPSNSNPTNEAWIISREKFTGERKRMFKGWKFAKQLESKFSIRHLLLEEPWYCKDCATRPTLKQLKLPKRPKGVSAFTPNLVIQKVRTAPHSTKEFKFYLSQERQEFTQWLKPFYHEFNQTTTTNTTATTLWNATERKPRTNQNMTSFFFANLANEFDTCAKILKEHPNYGYDFQLLIDQDNGNAYHLDFDRVYEKHFDSSKETRMLSKTLQHVSDFALQLHNLTALAKEHENQ